MKSSSFDADEGQKKQRSSIHANNKDRGAKRPVPIHGTKNVNTASAKKMKLTPPFPKLPERKVAKSGGGARRKKKTLEIEYDDNGNEEMKPPTITTNDHVVNDMSTSSPILIREKFTLGDRYSLQIGTVVFSGPRGFSYEAIIFTREGITDDDERKARKPFKFNIPAKLIVPLKKTLDLIISKSGIAMGSGN
ncbi:unnamed protein product [Sphagnum tenellum]